MAREEYVSVTADDWYQRRREDAEGEFFRKVADQGPRKGQGGSTRQGIYVLTAGGKLLAYKNAGQAPDVMRDVLRQGLVAWNKLPPEERKPGNVAVPNGVKIDARYTRAAPAGAQIVSVFTRVLEQKPSGEFQCCSGLGAAAARDHLWILAKEIQALSSIAAAKDSRHPAPTSLVDRILRFHLVDNTRGEPPFWSASDIRERRVELVVEQVMPDLKKIRIEGRVLLATDADVTKATRGYEAQLLGHATVDAKLNRLATFNLLVLGEHWGEGAFTRGARPGRSPLGVFFELASGDSPADRVPPQAARESAAYLGK
jgi:hypothetical protein